MTFLDLGEEGGWMDGGNGIGMMGIWELGGLGCCDGWVGGSWEGREGAYHNS